MVHKGRGGDTAALTFTAIQELFVVTGLETNAEPKRSEAVAKFHPQWRSSLLEKTNRAAEVGSELAF